MKLRSPFTLLPLLSVMVAAMGTLGFLAMTLVPLQARQESDWENGSGVRVEFAGAPAQAQPVPLECRAEGVTLHEGNGAARFFSLDRLRREVAIVRDLRERSSGQAGDGLTGDQEWLFFKAVIGRDSRLKSSLTLALHLLEMEDLKGEAQSRGEKFYPVLLVFPDGVPSYDLVSFLLETTSRFTVTAEPMLPEWSVRAALAPPPLSAPREPIGSGGQR